MEDSAVTNAAYLARINGSANADKATLLQMRKTAGSDQALRMAANEFAGVFLGQMFKTMSSTVQRSEMFSGGAGENMFRDMLNQEYARNAAYNDAYGLGQMIYQAMKRRNGIQEASGAAENPARAGSPAAPGKNRKEEA